MKRWHKVILIILSILLVIGISGFIVYKKVIEPMIDEKLDIVIDKLEEVSENVEIQDEIDSMVQTMIADGVIAEESIPTYNQLRNEELEKKKQNEEMENKASGEENKLSNEANTEKKAEAAPATSVAPTSKPADKDDLRSRMKAAMTADEFSFASSMYGKIDLGYAQSLYSSDKEAAKEYIYSRLTSAEISRSLEIYAKYSYLVR